MTKDFKISVSAALISALFSSPYAFANNDEVHFTAVQISPNSDPDSHVMIFHPEVRARAGPMLSLRVPIALRLVLVLKQRNELQLLWALVQLQQELILLQLVL